MNHRILISCLLLTCSAVAQTETQEKQRSAVPQDINARFLDKDLDAGEWVNRFEVESREVYANRGDIVAALHLNSGDCIADIGAGTGLFAKPFSQAVGAEGKVYAVDISPKLVEHVKKRVADEGMNNIEVILSKEDSTELPSESVDVVFICDTYHHFEYHADMLLSIRNALRRGGQLVVIDFERIPGTSREWLLGHVRAGKDEFKKEIQRSGFRFIEEVDIPGFQENYFLRFERP